MTDISIVPAGAGAGKTHHIQETLTQWVSDKLVRPERILAVTFTEAAASELRQRIRAAMIDNGMLDAALAIDRAYVSTIHGLGRRLLVEHAFANGSSPQQRLITDDERDLLIRQEIEQSDILRSVGDRLKDFGYKFNFTTGASVEDAFRKNILGVISLLRNLGERASEPLLAATATKAITETYGPTPSIAQSLGDALHAAAKSLLNDFPESLAKTATNKTASDAFRKDYANLVKACQNREALDRDWTLWNQLRNLRKTVRGSPTPEGYDMAADNVMFAAEQLLHHPGPLADAITHCHALVAGAQDVLKGYAERKRELGVIDFSDMVCASAKLLAEQPEVLEAVLGEIDCVIVDEFQDTNPIQFAFVWQLARQGKRTLLVGDTKQAIMGFQGADPRLTEELIRQHPGQIEPLMHNWRSDARIMAFINALGVPLFGADYHPLEAKNPAGDQTAIELLSIEATRSGKVCRPQHFAAEKIEALLDDTDMFITDRHSKVRRRVEPGDIAVLCSTHSMCRAYAGSLRELGIPVRVNEAGWWKSPIVQAASHALTYAIDPKDRHAALCLAVLGPPAMPLDGALRYMMDDATIPVPLLERLAGLWPASLALPVDQIVHTVIDQAGLRKWCDQLEDPAQSRADLLRFEAEATIFMEVHRDMREASGFYGHDARVFLGWLENKVSIADFDKKPNPSGSRSDGVEVVTWHSCKGREWPVVLVAGLDNDHGPRAGQFTTIFPAFDQLERAVDKAEISFAPGFAAPEVTERFLELLRPEAEKTCRRLLYVALTRARERLIIEWPVAHLAKKDEDGKLPPITAARVMAHQCSSQPSAEGILIRDQQFSAMQTICGKAMPATFDDHRSKTVATNTASVLRRSIIARAPIKELAQIIQPSKAMATARQLPANLEWHSLSVSAVIDDPVASAADKGTALHEALRVLLTRPELQHRVAAHCGLNEDIVAALATQANALKHFLSDRGYKKLHVEQPLQIQNADGTYMTAIIDLLAESDTGYAIVDHKSGAVVDHALRFTTYWPQLAAYADAVGGIDGKPVTGIAVHWTNEGAVSWTDPREGNHTPVLQPDV